MIRVRALRAGGPLTRLALLSLLAVPALLAFPPLLPPAVAAEAPPLPRSNTTRLIVLGTGGGPRGTAERSQPSNALVVNGKPYLIDAGNGVARQLVLAGIPFTTIRQIFITHNHDDHNADWGTLMGREWSAGQYEPMTVHGPPGTESMRKGFLQYFAPNAAAHYLEGASNMPPEKVILAHEIAGPGLVYQDANIKVTAVENCHYHFAKGSPGYGWQKSFAFRFQTPDRVVVFSGDTGACGETLVKFATGADILVHEVIDLEAIEANLRQRTADGSYFLPGQREALMTHMRTEHTSADEIGRVASAAGVKMVVLSHVTPGTRTQNDAAYSDGVKKLYKGPVVVAHDLMEF
jgi:ribonuclease BN (tRNA processing enzyme)